MEVRITIVYDNSVYVPGLTGDGGFSCLVEREDEPSILVDTGAKGDILLRNMDKLRVPLENIRDVFISHDHYDHVGGLPTLLKKVENLRVIAPMSCVHACHAAKEVLAMDDPAEIYPGIRSTGEVSGIEQALILESQKGLILILGCSHPGVEVMMERALQFGDIYALVGGFHTLPDLDKLNRVSKICACHCTSNREAVKQKYPEKWLDGGCGRVLTF